MALNRASNVPAADWLSQTSEKFAQFFMWGDMVFLREKKGPTRNLTVT